MTLPEHAQVVVIGGGVVGCSIAHHLGQRGVTDVVLVERRRLTEGSTWHAAGLVGQLRTSSSLTRLMQRSVATYRTLDAGWCEVGSLRLASSADRWEEIRRLATTGRSVGFDVELVSAREAAERFPLLDVDGVHGASWIPSDGHIDPSRLTQAFAAGARAAGVTILEDCRVERIERAGRRVVAVVTDQGRVTCDTLVNATGMWGTETARLAGVDIAVNAVEHQYVVTETSEQVPPGLPTLRDPDARIYLKPETGGALVVGGWEEGTRAPWRRIPADLGPELFAPDHDRFAGLAEATAHRIPLFGELGIRTVVNGPIPFSPDAEPLMGVTEDLDNLFHCCGFSAGVAAAGGAGWALANWIVDGDPGLDLWHFDVRRFGRAHSVPAALEARSIEAYGGYYAIAYPNRAPRPPRGQRRSVLHPLLAQRGAVFGTSAGWERPEFFADDRFAEPPTFGRGQSFPHVAAEHAAVRTDVGMVDESGLARFEILGPGAAALLARVAGAETDVAVGTVVPTPLLDARGGIEALVTVTRLRPDAYLLLTGGAFGRHVATFLLQHAPDDGSVHVRDVTSACGVLTLAGPRAPEVASALSGSGLDVPDLTARGIDLGLAPVLALRATDTGEPGWQFHVPVEYLPDVYERLVEAGVRDVGHRALAALRLERHVPVWGADVTSRTDPYAAGLGDQVCADRPGLLAGPALRRIRDAGPTQRLTWFSAAPEVVLHGGELLTHATRPLATTVGSAGYGHTAGRTIFSAYLPVELADAEEFVVDVATRRHPARRLGRTV